MADDNPILHVPGEAAMARTRMRDYMAWLGERGYGRFDDYAALHRWSVDALEDFWRSIWDYTGVRAERGPDRVLDTREMPGAHWFQGARLNFAENLLREAIDGDPGRTAVVGVSESRAEVRLSYGELLTQVGAMEAYLRSVGVQPGDRVAGIVANTHEPIVAMLACASMGAIWSSASPDFGVGGLVDRFAQIEPRVLITVDGYRYGGKDFERIDHAAAVCERIPSIETVIVTANDEQAPELGARDGFVSWDAALAAGRSARPSFAALDFEQPVYILFSSGTTGVPKCIVHGAGGALMQHSKELLLHADIHRDDVFFYFTTCGWMMWNWLVSGLLTGATLVLYDGNPGHPDLDVLWALAEREGITHFGTSAKFLAGCRNADLAPGRDHDLSALRVLLSTGSPLLPPDFDWVYEAVRSDVLLGSISGGTDLVSSFVGCCPLLPVRRGEIQCRLLGIDAHAFNDEGEAVIDECGELVCTQPVPSMPVKFWNDPDGSRYRAAYFDTFAGVWAHGDYILFTAEGGAIIYGRSDATLNVGGIRIGTAEIYRQVEPLEAIADAMVVAQPRGEDSRIVMLVVLNPGHEFDGTLAATIRRRLREHASPRHVPGLIVPVAALPYTRSGKKVEVAVAKLLRGATVDNTGAIANPESLTDIAAIEALEIPAGGPGGAGA
ncbi:acetoacetate--CoA ligase [Salinisphaera orenii]|uniref:Acetoacetyl-CoA synthetase n=1 Tax=Salinisphaera orenii YIM 95161 TaxID=1051139 RepID=A0A423PHR7_9GAMM|nr:acetoacetate--CoA ligase [Salinisphaera halophila]ROO25105.1 acetoacetyl-CoA synthetase [Salinisphaera halophila YIM 95161]